MQDEYEDDVANDRPLRSERKISFFRRLLLKIRFLSKLQIVILIVVILVLIFAGRIFISHLTKASSQDTNAPSATPTLIPSDTPTDIPSSSPTDSTAPSYGPTSNPDISPSMACVGPDGKTLYVSQQQCDAFNAAWATPTPTEGPITPTDTPSVTPTDTPTPTPTPGA